MIEQLIAKNEGKTIEFKESTHSLGGILKTVVTFANSAGGTIIIGVKDKTKELVGIPEILPEEKRLANAITDNITPLLTPDIEIQSIRDKELLIIRVSHEIGPYYLKSEGPEKGVYVRFGSTNRLVDAEMLDSLRLLTKKISYDELPHPQGHLDTEVMNTVFEWINKRPTAQALENLGIETSRSGKKYPSNGGLLLFGTNRLKLFPDSLIQCARFAGSTREKILDQFRLTLYSEQVKEIIIRPWGKSLLEYLKKKKSIDAKSAMKLWKVSARTTRTRLKQLQEKGIIVRIGTSESDPSASYIPVKHSS